MGVGDLLKAFYEASDGVTYSSESDYPLDVVHCRNEWGSPLNNKTFAESFGFDPKKIKEGDGAEFMDALSEGAKVKDVFEGNTGDNRVFRVESCNSCRSGTCTPIYLIGVTEHGEWVGFKGMAVET